MDKITLFHPYVSESSKEAVINTLSSRFIGQGPKVDEFESLWQEQMSFPYSAIAVGSGTDALHLAYTLAGIEEGDEVITPVFTCVATNIPLLYLKAKIVFADVKKDSLLIDPDDIEKKITRKTKAIVVVHYGGSACDMDQILDIASKHGLVVISDAAQAHGVTYNGVNIASIGDYVCFSFQATKLITTGDGGMLTIKHKNMVDQAKRLRWFGINRTGNMSDRWKNDITEVGYKYQMTDIAASMGIEALKEFNYIYHHQIIKMSLYKDILDSIPGVEFIGGSYLCTILSDKRDQIQIALRENEIESHQVHYRNDRYDIFKEGKTACPNMDALEGKYLVLPMHYYITEQDIIRICDVIRMVV